MLRRALVIAGVMLLATAGYFVWQPVLLFFAEEGCLDQGGNFDYVTRTCDFVRSQPYVSQNESNRGYFLAALLAAGLGIVSIAFAKVLKNKEQNVVR